MDTDLVHRMFLEELDKAYFALRAIHADPSNMGTAIKTAQDWFNQAEGNISRWKNVLCDIERLAEIRGETL